MKTFCTLVVLLLSFTTTFGQTVKGKTKTVKMKFEPQYEFTLPPNLYVNMDFADANENGLVEAEETAKLTLNIENKGSGPTQGLKVKLTSQKYDPEFKIGDEVFIREIGPGASKQIVMNLEAGFNVKTNEHKIQINVTVHSATIWIPPTCFPSYGRVERLEEQGYSRNHLFQSCVDEKIPELGYCMI